MHRHNHRGGWGFQAGLGCCVIFLSCGSTGLVAPSYPPQSLPSCSLSSYPSSSDSGGSGPASYVGVMGGVNFFPELMKALDFFRKFASARMPPFVPSISGREMSLETFCSMCQCFSYLGHLHSRYL